MSSSANDPTGALFDEKEYEIVSQTDVEDYQDPATGSLRTVAEIQKCLEPTDYLSPGNEYMKHLAAYVPGTGDWLRNSTIFQSWKGSDEISTKNQATSKCLWLKGVPGSGKSVFAASTAKSLHDSGSIVLFFFFRQIVATNHDPKYLVRDWLSQLLPHSQWLQHRLDAHLREYPDPDGDPTFLGKVLAVALRKVGLQRPVYCIVDALDEMDESQGDFIRKLKHLATTTPDNVRVMITSRPIPRIEAVLRDPRVESIKLDPTLIYPDIVRYVDVRLDTLKPRLSDAKEKEVKKAICERAKGLFLHARLMTDNLMSGLHEGTIVEDTLPTSLERLPRNLRELYTGMLIEHSRRTDITQEQQFTILQCVLHASRPLRLIELGSMVCQLRGEEKLNLKDGKELVRLSCGRLLEILEDESVSVIHYSFTEFLRDESRKGDQNAFPISNEGNAHAMLVQVSLKYLNACQVPEDAINDQEPESDPNDDAASSDKDEEEEKDESYEGDSESDHYAEIDGFDSFDGRQSAKRQREAVLDDLRMKYPLLYYVLYNLDYHMSEANAMSLTVYSALDEFFQIRRPAFRIWLLGHWEGFRPRNVNAYHVAAFSGWSDYTKHLIRQGAASLDEEDGEKRTPLSYAAEKGHASIVEYLLQQGARPNDGDRDGIRPIHYAAREGHTEVVKILLARGVEATTIKTRTTLENLQEMFGSDKDETPLYLACMRGHTEILKLFLPHLDDEWKYKALAWSDNAEMVEAIITSSELQVDALVGNQTRLFRAASYRDTETIKVLLKHGADPNCRSKFTSVNDSCPSGTYVSIDFNLSNEGPTAVHAWAGYPRRSNYVDEKKVSSCWKLLVDAGADLDVITKEGFSALHIACRPSKTFMGYVKETTTEVMVAILLDAGLNPNAKADTGQTPLHLTYEAPIIELLARYGADLSAKDNRGFTPVHAVVDEGGKPAHDALEKLLELGADPNVLTDSGDSALHLAMARIASTKTTKPFELLIKAGVDVNVKNKRGLPPFLAHQNIWRGRGENPIMQQVLQMLKEAGMDLNARDDKGRTVLHRLVGEYNITKEHLQGYIDIGCDIHARDYQGATILHYAIRDATNQHWDTLLGALFELGADPRTVDRDGNTVVHELVKGNADTFSYDYHKTLRRFYDLGTPVDASNQFEQTALHFACSRASSTPSDYLGPFLHGEVFPRLWVDALDIKGGRPIHYASMVSEIYVRMLLDAGASPEVITYELMSPLHIAARSRQPNIVGMLIEEYKNRGTLERYIDLKSAGDGQRTALHFACRSGNTESVRYLLAAGADPTCTDRRGMTPLHILAEFPREEAIWNATDSTSTDKTRGAVGISLNDNFRIGRRVGSERTADIVALLAEADADLDNVPTRQDWWEKVTPIDRAVNLGCAEMAKELKRRGCNASDSFEERILLQNFASDVEELDTQAPTVDRGAPGSRGRGRGRGRGGVGSTSSRPNPAAQVVSNYTKINKVMKLKDYDLLRDLANRNSDFKLEALHHLARWGNVDLFNEFLNGVENVEEKTTWTLEEDRTETLLGHACQAPFPNLAIIKLLVDEVKVNVNQKFKHLYWPSTTAVEVLAEGIHFWHIEALRYVLEAAEVTVETKTAALLRCVRYGGIWSESTLSLLLDYRADPNVLNEQGRSLLELTTDKAVARRLIEHKADVSAGFLNPLLSAVFLLQADKVELLLEAGADANVSPGSSDHWQSIFYYKMRYALHQGARPDDTSAHRLIPQVVESRKTKITQALLDHGADPMATYPDGSYILQKVIEEHGITKPLLSASGIDTERRGENGRTCLISACYPSQTPFHHWGRSDRSEPPSVVNISVAKELIEKGANVTATDDSGRTALHWLCTIQGEFDVEHQEVFNLLVNRCPQLVNLADNEGFSPFQLAVKSTQVWLVRKLISLGADPTSASADGDNALHILSSRLIESEGGGTTDEKLDLLQYLVESGVPINAHNKEGDSPLAVYVASPSCSSISSSSASELIMKTPLEIVQYFISAGADIQTKNNAGRNLLHLIAARNSQRAEEAMTKVFKLLMDQGVDPRAEDNECRTAIDVAVAVSQYSSIVYLFGEDGGDGDDDESSTESSSSSDESDDFY